MHLYIYTLAISYKLYLANTIYSQYLNKQIAIHFAMYVLWEKNHSMVDINNFVIHIIEMG